MSDTVKMIAQDRKTPIKTMVSNGIRVTIHTPENVAENIKRQKINRIYDILNPKTSC